VALLRVDKIERRILSRVVIQAAEYRRQLDERLASNVVFYFAEAWNKGRR
jgi:hypothetical protein